MSDVKRFGLRIKSLDINTTLCYILQMIKRLREYIKMLAAKGIKVPLIFDHLTSLPSLTMTSSYISFFMWLYALHLLIQKDILQGTLIAMSGWLISTVLYMIQKLSKFKLEIDSSPSFEIESEDSTPETK